MVGFPKYGHIYIRTNHTCASERICNKIMAVLFPKVQIFPNGEF